LRIATLLKQKDEEVEYLKCRLEENNEMNQEIESLANMLQSTQDTLKKLAAENNQLKQMVLG
jgi:predicted nuclease with TOPRIM domain